jgi:ring-1,2-phenylacetyl-CoA epoxidase subunit PaaC
MNQQLIDYILHLADTALIHSQRNSEWCGHGPVLEQDIAVTNISLDLLGQSRNFYQYAAQLLGVEYDEDKLAYLRTEREFKNLLIVELPNGDWGQTILKLYLFSQFQFLLLEQLKNSTDPQLAAIAEKSLKETSYHLRWSREWVIRLGDGTEESYQRMVKALDYLWPYTGEFFIPAEFETENIMGFNLNSLKQTWVEKVRIVLEEATLSTLASEAKDGTVFMHSGGKSGIHTEHMGFILTEMQYLQRTYPGATW